MTNLRQRTFNTPMPISDHYSDVFELDGEHCPSCCELAIDAWERMTLGGVQVRPNSVDGSWPARQPKQVLHKLTVVGVY